MKCIITANNQTGRILKTKGEYPSTIDALRESVAGWIASGELRNNRMLSVMVYVEPEKVPGSGVPDSWLSNREPGTGNGC